MVLVVPENKCMLSFWENTGYGEVTEETASKTLIFREQQRYVQSTKHEEC